MRAYIRNTVLRMTLWVRLGLWIICMVSLQVLEVQWLNSDLQVSLLLWVICVTRSVLLGGGLGLELGMAVSSTIGFTVGFVL